MGIKAKIYETTLGFFEDDNQKVKEVNDEFDHQSGMMTKFFRPISIFLFHFFSRAKSYGTNESA